MYLRRTVGDIFLFLYDLLIKEGNLCRLSSTVNAMLKLSNKNKWDFLYTDGEWLINNLQIERLFWKRGGVSWAVVVVERWLMQRG